MSNLTCQQARLIPIVEYLDNHGFKAQNIRGHNHWYISPFRDEKHASFKVNSLRNIWYDFGEGSGGNIIDLGIRLHQCSVADLLQMLAGSTYTPILIPVDRAAIVKQKEESMVNTDFNYLILNSVNMLSRALGIMGEHKNIFTYYDQNKAGRKATSLVMNTFKNAVDASIFYREYEDVNDYWVAQLGRGKPRLV